LGNVQEELMIMTCAATQLGLDLDLRALLSSAGCDPVGWRKADS
jgi:hypothetical protein